MPKNALHDLAAHEEIGHHVDIGAQREVLIDGLDPRRLGLRRRGEVALGAVEHDAARGRLQAAGDDLDQRRLAGAVVAEQGHHLAAADVEADAAQRFDGAEILDDVVELKDGIAHVAIPSSRIVM